MTPPGTLEGELVDGNCCKNDADGASALDRFSLKVKTDEGNWDIVGNNTPVFFLRDPIKFPIFIHTQKRNPQTNLKDPNAFWDYLGQNPESLHQVMILFSDRGTPLSYRHMHGFAGHTFKWVNAEGDWKYVQIHYIADAGFKTHTAASAAALDGANPDSATEDLFKAIDRKEFPSWTVSVQVRPRSCLTLLSKLLTLLPSRSRSCRRSRLPSSGTLSTI